MNMPGSSRDVLERTQKRKKNNESMKGGIEYEKLKTNNSG